MERLVSRTLIFLKFAKCITLPMAVMYLLSWVLQFNDEDTYRLVDDMFGVIPKFFDKIMLIEYDIAGMETTMGYIAAAGFFIVLYCLSSKYENKLSKYQKQLEADEAKKKFDEQVAQKIQKDKKTSTRLEDMTMFFGLLEFDLKYYDYLFKDESVLEKLKSQYTSMVSLKLMEKYPKIAFENSNKLFFTCKDFSKLHYLIQDIAQLYSVFLEIGNKKNIKTDISLSFWAGNKSINPKEAFKILNEINKLGYKNKIVMSSGMYYRYQKETTKHFDFVSLGISKLFGVLENGDDFDANLVYVKNVK